MSSPHPSSAIDFRDIDGIGRAGHVLAAQSIRGCVIIVGNQQYSVELTAGQHGVGRDFTAIIDPDTFYDPQSRFDRNQVLQVNDAAVFPQESMSAHSAFPAIAHDLPAGIDGARGAAGLAAQGTQIRHHTVGPQKAVVRLAAGNVGPAHHIATLVHRERRSASAAQSA